MNFGLLLSQMPRVQESRTHYDTMLSLDYCGRHKLSAFWRRLKSLIA
jgi:hypothetical protein